MKSSRILWSILIVLMGILTGSLSACGTAETPAGTPLVLYTPTLTPFQPLPPGTETLVAATENQPLVESGTPTIQADIPTPVVTERNHEQIRLWVEDSVPQAMREGIAFEGEARLAEDKEGANLFLGAIQSSMGEPVENTSGASAWVFALVAPFPTVTDGVNFTDIQDAWGGKLELFDGSPILMSQNTLNALSAAWGEPVEGAVNVIDEASLVDTAWEIRPSWAIVPFESLVPRWKVLRVDGISPLDKSFDMDTYPMVIRYQLTGDAVFLSDLAAQGQQAGISLPPTNRDPDKMTVVVMTGVTALVRATGAKMETYGMTYPAEDILPWLLDADITHISNEVSFADDCPAADPYQKTLRFCSRPEYIDLLDAIDVDVIELSGNHLLDWSESAFLSTLDIYQERGWGYYAGGHNEAEAQQPLKITHNGNKLAFIGCNSVGPPNDWATDSHPGAANCYDFAWIQQAVRDLAAEGYLPIVTLQHNEFYTLSYTPAQKQDFPPLSSAGAVIVSGSQAHYPNPFDFVNGNFIHYGLGNLFFDQMDVIIQPGIQREFIDRHVFYNNQYISTEILTAHLEDFARPRPMTEDERAAFLQEAFTASGW